MNFFEIKNLENYQAAYACNKRHQPYTVCATNQKNDFQASSPNFLAIFVLGPVYLAICYVFLRAIEN